MGESGREFRENLDGLCDCRGSRFNISDRQFGSRTSDRLAGSPVQQVDQLHGIGGQDFIFDIGLVWVGPHSILEDLIGHCADELALSCSASRRTYSGGIFMTTSCVWRSMTRVRVMQIPPEYVLRLAEQLKASSSAQ